MLCCWNTNVESHSPKQVMHLRKGEKNPSHNRRPRVKLKVAKDKSADLRLRRKRSSELEANMQNLEHRYKSDIMRLEKVRSTDYLVLFGGSSMCLVYNISVSIFLNFMS